MIQQRNSIKPLTAGCTYTSCIKIGGIPILPPLMTYERRLELEDDRKKATEFEKRLKTQRDSKVSKQTQSKHPAPIRSLANRLTFESSDSGDAFSLPNTPKLPSPQKPVPLPRRKLEPSSLSCSVFDVTQYSDEGVVLFNRTNLSASMVELDLTSFSCGDGFAESKRDSVSSPRPRLLRSNSYTLEAPSPVLLEHIKRQAELEWGRAVERKRLSLDLTDFDDSDYKTLTSRSSGFNKPPDLHCPQSSDERNEHINEDTQKGCDITVANFSSLVEDLAEVHFGSNKGESNENVHTRVAEAEAALHEVLNDIPENYARDIMELLERHKLEQEVKLESYAKFKQKLLDEHANTNGLTLPKCEEISTTQEYLSQDETMKEVVSSFEDDSNSCTINLTNSPSDTLTVLNTSTPLIELESDTEHLIYFHCESSICVTGCSHSPRPSRSANCSRELFAEKPDEALQRVKEQWAAGVLTAAAKGYLIRRLKRTERVSNLMQTIRDALLCAMSLHTDNSEVLDASDVELHRRLIQQVSAACYEFYDVFFTYTTQEQMAMIAADRQRLQEKQKRPSSSSSLKTVSSRSSSKDRKHSLSSAQQKKSLTPSFAA